MRIKNIEIKDYKIFSVGRIDFKKGLTVIVGGNGTGKTILFNMLRVGVTKQISGYKVVCTGAPSRENLNLIFVDEERVRFLSHSKNTKELMNRFGKQWDKTSEAVFNAVFPDSFLDGKQWDPILDDLFFASGHYLEGLVALLTMRKLLKVKDPLVLDSIFGRLDSDLRKSYYSVLKKFAEQIICLETDFPKPDYKLEYDRKTNKTTIVKKCTSK
jgi:energy-coupling factor transporter ATP-binding protein EcfA2